MKPVSERPAYCGEWGRRGGLRNQLSILKQCPHCNSDLFIVNQNDIVNELLDQRKTIGSCVWGSQAIRDSVYRIDCHRRACINTSSHRVRADGFNSVHGTAGKLLFDGCGHPRYQPTATDRDNNCFNRRQIFGQLESDGRIRGRRRRRRRQEALLHSEVAGDLLPPHMLVVVSLIPVPRHVS